LRLFVFLPHGINSPQSVADLLAQQALPSLVFDNRVLSGRGSAQDVVLLRVDSVSAL
jgi:hypothetical protein